METFQESNDPYSQFPAELKSQHAWVMWKLEDKLDKQGKPVLNEDGSIKKTKPPYVLDGSRRASSIEPADWSSFEEVVEACTNSFCGFAGIGYVFRKEAGITGIDLDHVRNSATGEIQPWAMAIIKRANSYTEISQSGEGVHIFVRGSVTEALKQGQFETYDTARYFTVSGRHLEGTPLTINPFDAESLRLEMLTALTSRSHSESPAKDNSLSAKEWGKICRICEDFKRRGQTPTENDVTLEFFGNTESRKKWEENRSYVSRTVRKAMKKVFGEPAPEVEESAEVTEEVTEPIKAAAPQLGEEALYGLAGDIVRKLEPQTESHPAAILLQILMMFGNILGHTAYYKVESTLHYGNLYGVKVGNSSKSRKGTASDRVNAIFELVDPGWFNSRVMTGLSSGEGLLKQVRDARYEEQDPDKPFRPPELVDPGVMDKRLYDKENEFGGQVLTVLQRDGNTLGDKIRNGWDGQPIQTMTSVTPMRSTNHHISILGDITGVELRSKLTDTDVANGFANRFLWLHCERTKLLPDGGEEIDWTPEVERLKEAIAFAREQQRVFMDRNAKEMWHRIYEKLSHEEPGIVGAILSRSEAQIIRLALLYTMLDKSDHIRSEHLKAAIAFWTYSEDSVRFIFDALTADQEMLWEWLIGENRKFTKTEISDGLYRRHRPADLIEADLAALFRKNMLGRDNKGQREATRYWAYKRRN